MRLDARQHFISPAVCRSLKNQRFSNCGRHMECACYYEIITSGHATRATSAISWLILAGWVRYSCESPTVVPRSDMGLSRLEAEWSRLEVESCTNQTADRSWYPHRNRRSVLRNRRSSWCWWHTNRNHLRHVASEHLGNLRGMAHPHCERHASEY